MQAFRYHQILFHREADCCRSNIVGVGECQRLISRSVCGCRQRSVAVVFDRDCDRLAGCLSVVGNACDRSGLAHCVGIFSGCSVRDRSKRGRIISVRDGTFHGFCHRCIALCCHIDLVAPLCRAFQALRHSKDLLDRETCGNRSRLISICYSKCNSTIIRSCFFRAALLVASRNCSLIRSIDDFGSFTVLRKILPGVGPVVACVQRNRIAGVGAVCFQLDINGFRADLADIVAVHPALNGRDLYHFRHMLIGNDAVILRRASGRGVASDLFFLDGVGDLLVIGVTIKSGPFRNVLVLVFRINRNGKLVSICVRHISAVCLKDKIGLELVCRRTLAVLIICVIPDLGDFEVGARIIVRVFNIITCTSILNGTSCCLAA